MKQDIYAALKKYYGYDSFRAGQEEVIKELVSGRPVLAVLPTGAGKSVCFQLPALMMDGLTIVVSPLISLMKDQAENLSRRNIPAAFLNSSLNNNEYGKILYEALRGKYKFLYVSPERLSNVNFRKFAQKANVTFVAVDEAHCVSQWGRSFRQDYYDIPDFLNALPNYPLVAAFTASATRDVRRDICHRLGIVGAKTVVTGFDRPNLKFMVKRSWDKDRDALEFLSAHKGSCGVIYCATRRNVERVTEFINKLGYKALRYHAGLGPLERKENQQAFLDGNCNIIVATNAFGMGIDKPDVRWVLHYNMPKDLESYYQEAGRAGRDGKSSECMMLFDKEDERINEFLIETAGKDQATIAHERELFQAMENFARSETCLRKYLLNYFGERAGDNCHNCSNCLSGDAMRRRKFTRGSQNNSSLWDGMLAGVRKLLGE
ncbi:MAG: ATP-dependent DNA helicase RecQ [Phascolarctobacterium sp.]|nr:ATP-dependent DNA helicase RecQ [Phascolarctobacterium sp.]